jgi:hypothetical protein
LLILATQSETECFCIRDALECQLVDHIFIAYSHVLSVADTQNAGKLIISLEGYTKLNAL